VNKRILIISFSNISSDPRVTRQIKLLSERYSLSVVGFGNYNHNNVAFTEVKKIN